VRIVHVALIAAVAMATTLFSTRALAPEPPPISVVELYTQFEIAKSAEECLSSGRAPASWKAADHDAAVLRNRTGWPLSKDWLLPHHGYRSYAVSYGNRVYLATENGYTDHRRLYGPFTEIVECPSRARENSVAVMASRR
jgi:hypothetical protein